MRFGCEKTNEEGIKKRRLSIPDSQSLLTLNLIPWKTQCKDMGFMLYNIMFSRESSIC